MKDDAKVKNQEARKAEFLERQEEKRRKKEEKMVYKENVKISEEIEASDRENKKTEGCRRRKEQKA